MPFTNPFVEKSRIVNNIYAALCLNIILILALFSISRVLFYFFNQEFFEGLTLSEFTTIMLGGIRFDLTAVLYVNALFIVMLILPFKFRFNRYYLSVAKWIFLIFNSIALAVNAIDFIYFKFTLRRTTADVFQQFENETNLTSLFARFLIDYWYAVLVWIVLVIGLVWISRRIKIEGPMLKSPIVFYSSGLLAMLLAALLFVGGVRGGFQHSTRPITLNDANKYVSDIKYVSLVLNTPFALIRTMSKTKIQKVSFYSDSAQLDSLYNPLHMPADSSSFKKDNVVFIILESFSKEFMGVFNKEKENGSYKGYTPFLDSLVQYSRAYDYSLANGRKSIDGLPSVVASIPSLGVPYILTPYSGNRINSLGSLLKQEGYHTSFFHGAPNGSMGFDAFLNVAGFDHYYGKTEYNNDADFDGWWGIWDEKFFGFYADKLNEFPQPFVSGIFSVSSHHPFIVPAQYESKFKGGREPILRCIQYTDYSLKKFFQKASAMPWFKNTLFVITADHASSNVLFDETHSAYGFFSIPIIFYKPDNSLASKEASIIQQIDIMPSILGYLKYNKPYIAYGRNDFDKSTEPFALNYKDNVYQFFQGDYLLLFDGQKAMGLYNFKTDIRISQNLQSQHPDIADAMVAKVKAIIQQYNNRMVENRMVVSGGQ
ncbi:MAG TPA: sulfatase-like hydrolase/transferase [Cyclobacteriaceae bacterium]|nr:sulfatase-like hydrolase/transferase [Cyclobacteriaceae bacterium]